MYQTRQFVGGGALRPMSINNKGRQAARLALGTAMKFELFINSRAAKQISTTIPPNVLARADKMLR